MKQLLIVRGLPGSGKSYDVEKFVEKALLDNKSVVVCSADSFFLDENGNYNFDPTKLGQAHAKSQITALRAMRAGVEFVIVDNTNSQKWEYEIYEEMAEAFGYTEVVTVVGKFDDESIKLYAERNKHGVPLDIIKRMAGRFEFQLKELK